MAKAGRKITARRYSKRESEVGIYHYIVACVGHVETVRESIKLRHPRLYDVAKCVAKKRRPGCLCYNVEQMHREF